jgi:hypothetical protein
MVAVVAATARSIIILIIAFGIVVVRSIEPFRTFDLEQMSQVRVQDPTQSVPDEKGRVERDCACECTATTGRCCFDQKVFAKRLSGRYAKGKSFPVRRFILPNVEFFEQRHRTDQPIAKDNGATGANATLLLVVAIISVVVPTPPLNVCNFGVPLRPGGIVEEDRPNVGYAAMGQNVY